MMKMKQKTTDAIAAYLEAASAKEKAYRAHKDAELALQWTAEKCRQTSSDELAAKQEMLRNLDWEAVNGSSDDRPDEP